MEMRIFLKTKDYAVTGEEFSLVWDEEREMLRTYPQPDQLNRFYQDESYISHTDRSKTFREKIYQLVKSLSLKKKESWLREFAKKDDEVLDVGAGTGSFVKFLRSKGWAASGMEPNSKARGLAEAKNVDLYATLDEISDKQYGILTLWHVLEHFQELDKGIEKLLESVREDGTIFIAVPNFKSHDAEYYREFWAGYDVPRHLWHFSRKAVEKIFLEKGWTVIGTKPMIFDSFYIALLSEQYRKGRFKWASAFWRGLRSNIHGWKTGEYSSLVYILKKTQKAI
jgi:2-polyprenyl-3-methyl-5-hydroxy-6-metoxy-1,4-benzoquinol methylase